MNESEKEDAAKFSIELCAGTDHAAADGEAADRAASYIDQRVIDAEERYDGFYAVCTNPEDKPETVVKVNKRRWEIEECFRYHENGL